MEKHIPRKREAKESWSSNPPNRQVKMLSRVRLFATLWTVAYQAPLSMGFSRQEYWSGVPLPSPLLDAQIFTIVMSSCWIDPLMIRQCPSLCLVAFFILRSILSDMRIATPAFICFPFAWNIFFHPLTFSLYVSLGLKWVSCGQRIYGSCFCIHSTSLCHLVREFNPFTFKVIIDIYVPIAIFLIVWGLFLWSFFFPTSFVLFSYILMTILALCLSCSCIVCLYHSFFQFAFFVRF